MFTFVEYCAGTAVGDEVEVEEVAEEETPRLRRRVRAASNPEEFLASSAPRACLKSARSFARRWNTVSGPRRSAHHHRHDDYDDGDGCSTAWTSVKTSRLLILRKTRLGQKVSPAAGWVLPERDGPSFRGKLPRSAWEEPGDGRPYTRKLPSVISGL